MLVAASIINATPAARARAAVFPRAAGGMQSTSEQSAARNVREAEAYSEIIEVHFCGNTRIINANAHVNAIAWLNLMRSVAVAVAVARDASRDALLKFKCARERVCSTSADCSPGALVRVYLPRVPRAQSERL